MATVTYCGGGDYKIYLDTKMLVLNERDISEIIKHFIQARYNTIEIPTNDSLEKDNESYQETIEKLSGLLDDKDEEILILENMLL